MGYNRVKNKMKKLLLLTIILCTTSFAQECFAQSDDPYYNIGYSVGSAIKKNTDENRKKNKAYREEISNTRRELDAEKRKLDSLDRLINMCKTRIEVNSRTIVLRWGKSICFYELDCIPETKLLTLSLVELDYLVFGVRLEDPSSVNHYLSCKDVTIQYKTVYGENVVRKTSLKLEVSNHNKTYELDDLFDLPEDAIDETTLSITFTGTKITIK